MLSKHGTADDPREAARVLVFDARDRLLLLKGHDPALPARSWWFTIGGGLDGAESPREAAVRELREEAGIVATADELVGPVWERTAHFDFMEEPYVQHEVFYVLRVTDATPRTERTWSEVERDMLDDLDWFAAADLADIAIEVFPERLGELVETVLPWDGKLRDLGMGG